MKILNDFRCGSCGHTFEKYADNLETPRCHECGGETKRIITGTSFTLEGVTGDFPGASFKWEKRRDQKMEYERSKGMTTYGQDDY